MMETHTDVICPFCGTLCDDIEVQVEGGRIMDVLNACKLGTAKFMSMNKKHRPLKPRVRGENGFEETTVEDAVERVARMLVEAKKPLLYGWSTTECEAHSVGIELAEEVGGVIDSHSSVCHGPSVIAIQDVGYPSVTLGEVKNRADLDIYWGSNPMHAHPRHMSRYSRYPRGYFRERGQADRTVVVIDVRKTDTASIADKFLQVEPGGDYELANAFRAALNGVELPDEVAGVPKKDILQTLDIMKEAQFGILFFGVGLTMSPGKHRNIDCAIKLVADLNRYTKFSIMAMRGHYNVTGFSEVLTWQSGFPFGVDYTRGRPWYNPGETTSIDLLTRGEVDACLVIGADPGGNFPRRAVEHFARIPTATLEPHETPTTYLSDVVIPTAIAGIEVEGTAYRMDAVPLQVRRFMDPPEGVYPDREILKMILDKVREIKNGA
ncbi:MAG: formylmethanofuran dehydrogenase subunit B [Methanobacteriota archaeon]|nr:MAG: formylmethanofuran dehydrogenase subunit B [Euryarchaeota archaeon]